MRAAATLTHMRTQHRESPLRTLSAGFAVVVLWAGAFPAIRVASPALGAIGLSAARLLIAAAALLTVAIATKMRLPQRRDLPLIITCGFFGMTAYQLLLNWGEHRVPAGTSSIIVACAPLVSVAVAATFLGDRLTPRRVIGSAVALAGVALVCLSRASLGWSANVWIVAAAAVVQGLYHPLSKPLLRRYSGLEVAVYTMSAGTLMTLPLVPFGWHQTLHASTAAAWLAAVYLGLLPSALGFVLWGYAVARLPVATSTSLLYLVPPVAVLIAYLWLGEAPTLAELFGGVVALLGVITVSLPPKAAPGSAPAEPPAVSATISEHAGKPAAQLNTP
jgi:drug/metabolite transporter (DMT)-like permease